MKLWEMSPAIRRVVDAARGMRYSKRQPNGLSVVPTKYMNTLREALIALDAEPDVSVDGVADALPVVRDDERRDAAHAALKALGLEIPEGGE